MMPLPPLHSVMLWREMSQSAIRAHRPILSSRLERVAYSVRRLCQPSCSRAWPTLYQCSTEMKEIIHLYSSGGNRRTRTQNQLENLLKSPHVLISHEIRSSGLGKDIAIPSRVSIE